MNNEFIDFDVIVRTIIERAVMGLDDTLKYAEARAQHYAPVRAIFKRDRRGTPEFPRVLLASGSSSAKTAAAYRRHPISTAAQFEAFKASRAPRRRIDIPNNFGGLKASRAIVMADAQGSARDLVENHGPRIGHANSEMPVIRVGDVTLAGDFRRVQGGKLLAVAYAKQTKGGRVMIKPPPSSRNVPISPATTRISAGGAREIQSGRATVVAIHGDHQARVGGALKNSIVAIKAAPTSRRGGTIWGYVQAGGLGVEYAKYQEFGTAHNRAHPYLRPALYESRSRFIDNVEKRLDGAGV